MPDIKRLNYFNSQFLVDKDFRDEQSYHLAMRRQHNLALHGWGWVAGLNVSASGNNQALNVSPGMAIDKLGREIMLASAATVDISALKMGASVWLTLAYQERFDPDDAQALGIDTKYTRSTESAVLALAPTEPAYDGAVIVLVKLTLQTVEGQPTCQISTPPKRGSAGHGIQPDTALTVRHVRVTGIVDLPPPEADTPLRAPLRVTGRLVIDPNEALTGADGSGALSIYSAERDVGFHLRVTPDNNGARRLSVSAGSLPNDIADALTISSAGNVGINAPSADYVRGPASRGAQPYRALTVNSAICAGTSDLYFTDTSHSHTGIGNLPGYAAIENSGESIYNALMILGRNIGTETAVRRVVKIWDELVVNGGTAIGTATGSANLTVYGDIYCTGSVKKLVVSSGGGLY